MDKKIYLMPKVILEKPKADNPTSENPTQLNKDIQNTDLSKKEEINKDGLNTDSIPILSPNPSPLREPPLSEKNGKEEKDAYKIYEELIKDNIEYEHLINAKRLDRDRIDEILDLILETVCSKRKRILIAGDEYPAELVKAKFMKLDSSHIEFVLDCMQENTTKVRNIKQYLKAVLFNAPSTIGNYYTALVNHDMYGGNNMGDRKYLRAFCLLYLCIIVKTFHILDLKTYTFKRALQFTKGSNFRRARGFS